MPARRKFLRSPRAEYAACLDAVKRLAMARPDVGFSLDHDGRRILTVQPAAAPARVAELLTHELERHGVGIDCSRDGLRLTGVISLPTFNRGMADQQYLFVNARPRHTNERSRSSDSAMAQQGAASSSSTGSARAGAERWGYGAGPARAARRR